MYAKTRIQADAESGVAETSFERIHELRLKLTEAIVRKDFHRIAPQFEALRRGCTTLLAWEHGLDVASLRRSHAVLSLRMDIASALDEIESTLWHDWSEDDKLRILELPMRRLKARLEAYETVVMRELRASAALRIDSSNTLFPSGSRSTIWGRGTPV